MAFGTITSQGVGANLDLANIVTKLMEIERIPLNRLEAKKTSFDAKISALGTIKGSLSSLQTSLAGLTSGSSFQASNATSSNTAVVKATGTSGAIAGNYSLEVSQLAQSQKLVAAGQADATAVIGDGTATTLTIDLGSIAGGTFDDVAGTYSGASFTPNGNPSVDIVIDSSNNSLEGIRDAINSANAGVKATIVNDGDAANPYRLVLSAENGGADESIRIAVGAGDATLELSNLLSHDSSGTQSLSETVTAQNAILEVDGIPVTKSTNTITDVIEGVTLELAGLTAGTPVTISTSLDTETAKTAVEAFVEAYNSLREEIKTQTSNGEGALSSDSATRQILSFVRNQLNTAPTGITGAYANLSSIGISFQSDGTLALDESKLNIAIQSDSKNVTDLFSSADGYGTRLDTLMTDMLSATGSIALRTEAFEERIDSLEDRKVTMEGRLTRTEARMRARFTALDVLVASMSVTSNYLTQQLSALNANSS